MKSASIAGHYAAVSESEWTQELRLSADGTAELTGAAWIAGKPDGAVKSEYSGRWTSRTDTVTVHLVQSMTNPERVPLVVEFRYDRQLSLSEIGKSGSLPGLVKLSPGKSDSAAWVAATMWQRDGLKGIESGREGGSPSVGTKQNVPQRLRQLAASTSHFATMLFTVFRTGHEGP